MEKQVMDGNTAACYVSYAFSEIAFIYPITPSSPMAEQADLWASQSKNNLFNSIPRIVEMQSEGGAAGAVHGALTCGALTTTYTCSQGLLLMLPNMYKIAGELLPTVFHVSARALSTHALSIFGDHQDVMATRQTGFAMLCSSNVQECMDLALVAHLSTLQTSVPFLHFFDGFKTSHEQQKIEVFEREEMLRLINGDDIKKFKSRALSPDAPVQRGTAQNEDIYFQNRERCNTAHQSVADSVQAVMDKVAEITGRKYRLFDYFGAQNAEHVIVMMGSGSDTMYEVIDKLCKENQAVGLLQVRLYRPFNTHAFIAALPQTCKRIAVLDRTKECGSIGEPLYLDVCAALQEHGAKRVEVFGGRYGLGGKDFTPAMALAVIKNLRAAQPKNHFTVGIDDDVTFTSLDFSTPFYSAPEDCTACLFYGLGSDGSVGANKNSIKIIGNHTPLHVQAYFAYDSRKSGGVTISHLRFGTSPIHSAYLIDRADFIACHNPSYLTRLDMLSKIKEEGTFLLNCPWETQEQLTEHLPANVKQALAQKRVRLYVIDATKIAQNVGLKGRTGTIMQAAFFYLQPKILPYKQAISHLKEQLRASFKRKGENIVQANYLAVDVVQNAITAISVPDFWQDNQEQPQAKTTQAGYFETFITPILRLQGDNLPVSVFQADGTVPTATARLEKHGAPPLLPVWIKENCIQCNQCAFVCPHACIRPYLVDVNADMPPSFDVLPATGEKEKAFRIQVSPNDCMGCSVCANTCPTKEKALVMQPSETQIPTQEYNWEYAQTLPQQTTSLPRHSVKGSQFYPPLFEFSYACAGCGETPYIKVLTQLFGEHMVIANATGCSSIYGGNAPICPYSVNRDGKGPAWANSLFEDNAEFGLGMRLAAEINNKKHSIWLIGGDGWAYDIGYGGLDHVLALGANVNVLVLDSEVYSNTGGQLSKATPLGASARFSVQGKRTNKKPLGLMAMQYNNVYVAQVSMGANKAQLLTALTEAQAFNGPSLIIAYSPCIAHGVNLSKCMEEEQLAVACGYWPLYRFNPDNKNQNKPLLSLDSKAPNGQFREFLQGEGRFSAMFAENNQETQALLELAEKEMQERYAYLQKLAQML